MPNAEDALKGMLAEGVTPDDIIAALKESGYSIEESEGPSEEEEPEGMEIEIEMEPAGMPEDKRMDAAKKAMAKHGY